MPMMLTRHVAPVVAVSIFWCEMCENGLDTLFMFVRTLRRLKYSSDTFLPFHEAEGGVHRLACNFRIAINRGRDISNAQRKFRESVAVLSHGAPCACGFKNVRLYVRRSWLYFENITLRAEIPGRVMPFLIPKGAENDTVIESVRSCMSEDFRKFRSVSNLDVEKH